MKKNKSTLAITLSLILFAALAMGCNSKSPSEQWEDSVRKEFQRQADWYGYN